MLLQVFNMFGHVPFSLQFLRLAHKSKARKSANSRRFHEQPKFFAKLTGAIDL
jgi:hypothetical protein